MTRRFLSLSLVALLMPAALLAWATPAAAVGPFGPVVTVVQAGCRPDGSASGDSVVGSDGIVRGFVSFTGGNCGTNPLIRYFEGSGASWTSIVSPYRGRVLGVAWDGSATFLLHTDGSNIRITKRDSSGFTPGRVLSTHFGERFVPSGDVIAAGGRWWAVWSEQVGSGLAAQNDLFQGLTLGQGHFHDGINRQRITFVGLDDTEPSLTFVPGGGSNGQAMLAWHRQDIPLGGNVIRVARAHFDGRWSSQSYTPANRQASSPDLFTYGPIIFGTYVLDNQIIQATNPPASLITNSFSTGYGPRIGSSGGRTFVAWTSLVQHVHVGEATAPGVATQADLTPTAGPQQQVSVTGRAGKATVLGISFVTNRLWARTQT
jgi:hypothetical protein